MPERDVFLDAVRSRIDRALTLGEGEMLLTAEAEREAERLAAAADPAADLEVAEALGWFRWLRHRLLPEAPGRVELVLAVEIWAPLMQDYPDAVPGQLRVALASGATTETAVDGDPNALARAAIDLVGDYGPRVTASQAERAVRNLRDAVLATPRASFHYPGRMSNLARALVELHKRNRQPGTLDDSVQAWRDTVAAGAPDHPLLYQWQDSLAHALLAAFDVSGQTELLTEAVDAARSSVADCPPDDSNRASYLTRLASSLLLLADAKHPELLTEAVDAAREAVAIVPADDPDIVMILVTLGRSLDALQTSTGTTGLLEEKESLWRRVVEVTSPDDPGRAYWLNNLSSALWGLFHTTGDARLLTEVELRAQQAVDVAPPGHPARPALLERLEMVRGQANRRPAAEPAAAAADEAGQASGLEGNRLLDEYELTGDPRAMEAGIRGLRAVAENTRFAVARAALLSEVGYNLQMRFERTGDLSLLEAAVQAGRDALAAAPDGSAAIRAICQSHLAGTLRAVFVHTGDARALDEAVRLGRAALAVMSAGSPDRAGFLSNLSFTLRILAGRGGQTEALTEAVELARDAVELTAEDDPELGATLNNAGLALLELFEATGDLEHLDEAVRLADECIRVTARDHPAYGRRLGNLALTLLRQAEAASDLTMLHRAVQLARTSVEALPPRSPERPVYLSDFGESLDRLYRRTRAVRVLVDAVNIKREAVEAAPPGHPLTGLLLHNVAVSLLNLAQRTGAAVLYAETVAVCRDALEATAHGDPRRAAMQSLLGAALRAQAAHGAEPGALPEAVRVGRAAVENTPRTHIARATALNSLAETLLLSVQRDAGQAAYLGEARGHLREAAESTTATIEQRITAYRTLANVESADGGSGLDVLQAAVSLLEMLAPADLSRSDREHRLRSVASGLALEAAAAATKAGSPALAVELLEQTRGVLAATVPGQRGSDLSTLRGIAPELATEIEALRTSLNAPLLRETDFRDPDSYARAAEAATAERRRAYTRWSTLLNQIRAEVPGCRDFLRPVQIAQLCEQARQGPIVYVYTAPARCDALIVTADPGSPVRLVPLGPHPDPSRSLTHEAAVANAEQLSTAALLAVDARLPLAQRIEAQDRIHAILAWLWDCVTAPVLDALGEAAAPEGDGTLRRLWWCPAGVMTYFPLHAAGHHTEARPGHADTRTPRTLMDRVVSSYTPTIRALRDARVPRPPNGNEAGDPVVIITGPDIDGPAGLPRARREAEAIRGLIPGAVILNGPTRQVALNALRNSRVAHLACHAVADWDDPGASRLILDERSRPLTVADLTFADVGGELAYLSACETGVSSADLVDESVHLTGAFHLAGFRHVIGTLWPVNDAAAYSVAVDVYTRLTGGEGGALNFTDCARAIHDAIRHARSSRPDTPTAWAAFLHTGP